MFYRIEQARGLINMKTGVLGITVVITELITRRDEYTWTYISM